MHCSLLEVRADFRFCMWLLWVSDIQRMENLIASAKDLNEKHRQKWFIWIDFLSSEMCTAAPLWDHRPRYSLAHGPVEWVVLEYTFPSYVFLSLFSISLSLTPSLIPYTFPCPLCPFLLIMLPLNFPGRGTVATSYYLHFCPFGLSKGADTNGVCGLAVMAPQVAFCMECFTKGYLEVSQSPFDGRHR